MTCTAKEPWSNLTTTSKCSTPCLFNHAVNGTGVFGVGFFAMFVSMIQRAELEEQLSQHPLVLHTATQLRTAWPEGCEIPKPNSAMDFRHISGNVRERIKRGSRERARRDSFTFSEHSRRTSIKRCENGTCCSWQSGVSVCQPGIGESDGCNHDGRHGSTAEVLWCTQKFERQGIFSYAGHLFQRFKLRRMFAMAQEREFMYGFPRNTLAQRLPKSTRLSE